MNNKMTKVAITQRVVEHAGYKERRDALSQDWTETFSRHAPDYTLFPVPNCLTNEKHNRAIRKAVFAGPVH